MMARSHPLVITLDTAPASDGWGFVGRVVVGEFEAYRTLRAYATPTDAKAATEEIVGRVLGAILAGEEWRSLTSETQHAARRADLNFGLQEASPAEETASSSSDSDAQTRRGDADSIP
jgi:hypothetical protein